MLDECYLENFVNVQCTSHCIMQVQRHGGVLALFSSKGRGFDGMWLGDGLQWKGVAWRVPTLKGVFA